jgi:hypothetical protein
MTSINCAGGGTAAWAVLNPNGMAGLYQAGLAGTGVMGDAFDTGAGVAGQSVHGIGVVGSSGDDTGVAGVSWGDFHSTGVRGDSDNGAGVVGSTYTGRGVHGQA